MFIQSRMVSSEIHNIRMSSVQCVKRSFKLYRAFKVIQGHPYWCWQKSRTLCRRNVQLMSTIFLRRTKIYIATGKLQIRRFQRPPHHGL